MSGKITLPGITAFQNFVNSKLTAKLTGNDSTFGGAVTWVSAFGSLSPNVATYPGNMYLNFTSGNQAVKIVGKVAISSTGYLVKIKCKIDSGAGSILQLGSFGAAPNTNFGINITPSTTMRWYYAYLHTFTTTDFYIGVPSAANNATKFLIDEIQIYDVALADLYNADLGVFTAEYTTGLFSTLSKAAQRLLPINIMGDSILANIAGAINGGDDEGSTLRPTRLVTKNVARNIYDATKYNVPSYRRLDHAAWTKSGADFVEQSDSYMFISTTIGEKYWRSVTALSYVEITVPDGVSNFALVYGVNLSVGGVNFDSAISVTLNGGSIASYGASTINAYSTASINGHKTALYTGLPAGANTIRFTKANNTTIFAVWGGLWWNGDTMKLNNYAVGGQTIAFVQQIVNSHNTNHGLTNWLIEFPNINNCATSMSVITQIREFLLIVNNRLFDYNNTCFFTIHPMGKNPISPATNFWTLYSSPIDFKQRSTLDIMMCVFTGVYFMDLFRMFERDLLAKGGTLSGGDGGLNYTSDGQHLTQAGIEKFSNYLIPKLPAIPA